MLWTALAIVISGFGVTWQLIALMMKQQAGSGEIAVDQSTKEAFSRGEAHLWLNDKQLTRDATSKADRAAGRQQQRPDPAKEPKVKPAQVIPSDKDDPTFLERTPDGNFVYKPLQRRVAESVLSQGGKIKLAGSDATIVRLPDLPKGSLRIEEIDLAGVASIPADEIDLIKKLPGVA